MKGPYHATILVVEDDPDDRELICRAFRQIGVSGPIQMVEDGAEAIAYMRGEGKYADRSQYPYPTFITTDLKMPRADGFEVLIHLKRNPDWAVIPTIVLSASQDLDDIRKAYMLGASSYFVKPHRHDELAKLLGAVHTYWQLCEVPQVDATGRQLPTEGRGKLGERFG